MKAKYLIVVIFSLVVIHVANAKKVNVIFLVTMDCMSCKQKIEKNIAFEKGVKAMNVNFKAQTVEITYDDTKTDIEKLQKGFGKIGYKAEVRE